VNNLPRVRNVRARTVKLSVCYNKKYTSTSADTFIVIVIQMYMNQLH